MCYVSGDATIKDNQQSTSGDNIHSGATQNGAIPNKVMPRGTPGVSPPPATLGTFALQELLGIGVNKLRNPETAGDGYSALAIQSGARLPTPTMQGPQFSGPQKSLSAPSGNPFADAFAIKKV